MRRRRAANLDLGMELLQVLHDRAIDCAPKICVVIGNHARLIPYIVENVLEASLAEELVPSAEGNLDDASKLGEFPSGVVLNVRDAFKVGCSSAAQRSGSVGKYGTPCEGLKVETRKTHLRAA